jgi:rhodanese-related sulfurtransferase
VSAIHEREGSRVDAVSAVVSGLARGADRLPARDLARLVAGLGGLEWVWRPMVQHDPVERWYKRLHRDRRVDIWLIGWTEGQDTTVHDHGGSSGAFWVADGMLTEGYSARTGQPLRMRQLGPGRGSAFGSRYVHIVGNQCPTLATSLHAYSPPLSRMTVYQIGPDGMRVPVETLPVDRPEPMMARPGRVAPNGMAWPQGIDELLAHARRHLRRRTPHEAAEAVQRGAVLIDIRPVEQRREQGEIPGALIIPRNVLEWRLDPRSEACLPGVASYDREIILVCVEGYASTLAAATLRRMGLVRATDLEGGFMAWKAAGLPVRRSGGTEAGAAPADLAPLGPATPL